MIVQRRSRAELASLAGIYGVAGFAAVGLETLWIREISLHAGSTVVAAALVITAFFLGAAGGNLVGGALAARIRRPLRTYAVLEFIGAAVAFGLYSLFRGVIAPAFAEGWLGAAGMAVSLMMVGIPAGIAGAAFPFLAQQEVAVAEERIARGGFLYGANLTGAAFGVAAGVLVLPLWFGMAKAFALIAGAQAVGALLAWFAAISLGRGCDIAEPVGADAEGGDRISAGSRSAGRPSPPGSSGVPPVVSLSGSVSPIPDQAGRYSTLILFFTSGALALASQGVVLAWTRQIMSGSAYALAGVLAVFLAGLGAGSFLAAGARRRGWAASALLPWAALLAAASLALLPFVGAALAQRSPPDLGADPIAMLGSAVRWSFLIFGLPCIVIGMVFPFSWEMWVRRGATQAADLSRIVAVNKVGAACGIWFCTFALLPSVGLSSGTSILAAGYGILAVVLIGRRPHALPVQLIAAALVVTAIGFSLRGNRPLGLSADEKPIAAWHGAYGPVTVIENTATHSRSIVLNTRQRLNGTGRALSTQHNQAWVPLLFAPSHENVVVIGMASGITAAASLEYPIGRLSAFELVPEVARAAETHFRPWNEALFSDSRAGIQIGDGRALLRGLETAPDVIICDLLFPDEEGAANLYSRDFLLSVRSKLSDSGVFCLWLPCYQLEPRTADTLLATFAQVFPRSLVVRANFDPTQPVIGLLGSKQPIPVGREALTSRISMLQGRTPIVESPFLRSPDHAWLAVVGDLHVANVKTHEVPSTTDDRPFIAWWGPADPKSRRLVGMPFVKWIDDMFPLRIGESINPARTPRVELLRSMAAARAYSVAAVADSVITGDTRPDEVRMEQTIRWISRAREANPAVVLGPDDLGR